MPNINISEADKSTFADQQFIQIAYNGKTNIKSIPLTYRVTFTVDGNPYYIVDIGENQKISAPSVVPTKEGYTFKNWLLGDEAFDFNNIIEESITLVAEFEEAGKDKHFTYDNIYVEGDIVIEEEQGVPYMWLHKVTDEVFTPESLINSALKFYNQSGMESGIVLHNVKDSDLIAMEGLMAILVDGEMPTVISGNGTLPDIASELSGTYFYGIADQQIVYELNVGVPYEHTGYELVAIGTYETTTGELIDYPYVMFETNPSWDYYSRGDNPENAKHTLFINDEILTNQMIVDSYLGNSFLLGRGDDTGENWCFGAPVLVTRTAQSIKFGVLFTIEEQTA